MFKTGTTKVIAVFQRKNGLLLISWIPRTSFQQLKKSRLICVEDGHRIRLQPRIEQASKQSFLPLWQRQRVVVHRRPLLPSQGADKFTKCDNLFISLPSIPLHPPPPPFPTHTPPSLSPPPLSPRQSATTTVTQSPPPHTLQPLSFPASEQVADRDERGVCHKPFEP